jgi:hypothetical protein
MTVDYWMLPPSIVSDYHLNWESFLRTKSSRILKTVYGWKDGSLHRKHIVRSLDVPITCGSSV